MKTTVATLLLVIGLPVTAMAAVDSGPSSTASGHVDYDSYGELDAMYGIGQGAMFLAPMVEGGRRLSNTGGGGSLWIRGAFVAGSASEIDGGEPGGSVIQGRLGLEWRACALPNILCGTVGADLAMSRVKYPTEMGEIDSLAAQVLPRVGVEVGYHHVRLRVGAELGVGTSSRYLVGGMNAGIIALW